MEMTIRSLDVSVEPLLVTHNNKGEIEGVKYDRITVALINGMKEQQEQIKTLQALNTQLSARLRAVERVLGQRSHSAKK
jgi:hypothetical protein